MNAWWFRFRVIFITILFKYFRVILPIVWKEVHGRKYRPLNTASTEDIDEESHEVCQHN